MMMIAHEAIRIELSPVLLLISSEVSETMVLKLRVIYEPKSRINGPRSDERPVIRALDAERLRLTFERHERSWVWWTGALSAEIQEVFPPERTLFDS